MNATILFRDVLEKNPRRRELIAGSTIPLEVDQLFVHITLNLTKAEQFSIAKDEVPFALMRS